MRAFQRQRIGLALGRLASLSSGVAPAEQPAAELAGGRGHRDPRRAAPRSRRRATVLAASTAATGVRGRPRSMLLPARPDQLDRAARPRARSPPPRSRWSCSSRRSKLPPAGMRIEHDVALRSCQRLRRRAARLLGRLGRQPQFEPAVGEPRGGGRGLERGVERGGDIVARARLSRRADHARRDRRPRPAASPRPGAAPRRARRRSCRCRRAGARRSAGAIAASARSAAHQLVATAASQRWPFDHA